MSLQGNLADLPFEDLLEIITRRDNPAVLRINNPSGLDTKAVIYLLNRELHTAYLYRIAQNGTIVTTKRGEDVVHHLFGCADAQFYFDIMADGENLPERNIFSSIRQIFLANVFRSDSQPTKPVSTSPTEASTNLLPVSNQLPTTAYNQTAKNLTQPPRNDLSDNKKSSSAKRKQGNWINSLMARLIRL